jgi:hypothetical protein
MHQLMEADSTSKICDPHLAKLEQYMPYYKSSKPTDLYNKLLTLSDKIWWDVDGTVFINDVRLSNSNISLLVATSISRRKKPLPMAHGFEVFAIFLIMWIPRKLWGPRIQIIYRQSIEKRKHTAEQNQSCEKQRASNNNNSCGDCGTKTEKYNISVSFLVNTLNK